MYVLSEIETCKKIKRFVLCSRGKKCYRSVCYFSGLFTVVCLYVICGKLLHTLAITTPYFSGLTNQAVHGCQVRSKHWLLLLDHRYCAIFIITHLVWEPPHFFHGWCLSITPWSKIFQSVVQVIALCNTTLKG